MGHPNPPCGGGCRKGPFICLLNKSSSMRSRNSSSSSSSSLGLLKPAKLATVTAPLPLSFALKQ